MNFIEQHIMDSEVVQSAITEALHRLYFDSLDKKNISPEDRKIIHDHYASWFMSNPSFRVTLTKAAARYSNKTDKINVCYLTDRPKVNSILSIKIEFNLTEQYKTATAGQQETK